MPKQYNYRSLSVERSIFKGIKSKDVHWATDGDEILIGGIRDDVYIVDSENDQVIEDLDQGFDTIISQGSSYTLDANVERLVLADKHGATGIGNELDNEIYGHRGDDQLYGLDGDDLLSGAGGNDTLDGGNGIDTAFYKYSFSDYQITQNTDGSVTVTALIKDEGTDLLINIERLEFSDGYVLVSDLFPSAPSIVDPTEPVPTNDDSTTDGNLDDTAPSTDDDTSPPSTDDDTSPPSTDDDTSPPSTDDDTSPPSTDDGTSPPSTDGGTSTSGSSPSPSVNNMAPPDLNSIDIGFTPSGQALWVGSGEQYTTLKAAVAASQSGDTIYIRAGTYVMGQIKLDHDLQIIGVGGPAHLVAGTAVGKGILVTRAGASLYVENLEFSGAHSGDRNGSGIRHQGGTLTVVNSYFHDNDEGILGSSSDGTGSVYIFGSEFDNNGYGDGLSHGIYIRNVANLYVVDSYFSDTNVGHHIKSMADVTQVWNSVLDDAGGTSSYAVDVSKGGDLYVFGNTIIQSATSDNKGIIGYSVSRGGNPGEVIIQDNVIIDNYTNGIIVRNRTDAIIQIIDNDITDNTGTLSISSGLSHEEGNLLNGVLQPTKTFDFGASYGSQGSDILIGTNGDDIFNGLDGDDFIAGGQNGTYPGRGSDTLFGEAGNDTLVGGNSSDQLYGGDGDDFLHGGKSNDFLAGGAGNDTLVGGRSGDIMLGGDGNDVIYGGFASDKIKGGNGFDISVYEHNLSQYRVRHTGDGRTLVKAYSDMSDWGEDKLANVEVLQFADGIYDTITHTFTPAVTLDDINIIV